MPIGRLRSWKATSNHLPTKVEWSLHGINDLDLSFIDLQSISICGQDIFTTKGETVEIQYVMKTFVTFL